MSLIKDYIQEKKRTLLCVGPMSKNCIDVSVEISRQYDIPMTLIASRRQIDADCFGGGYVEKFTTQEFSKYVKSQGADKVYLARDHGGPWQSVVESSQNMDITASMKSAKKSFEIDILSDFDFIHIDPSIPVQGESLTVDKILDRLFELYSYSNEVAEKNNKKIEFELGTEEQDGYGQDLDKFEYFLQKTLQFCDKEKIQKPTFVVAQTGTKVMETKNTGIFQNKIDMDHKLSLNHLLDTLKICNKYGLYLKEHNTDYLNNEALALRPVLGIHSSNVAPEFGVVETRALLYLLGIEGFKKEMSRFIDIALKSNKWNKWMISGSDATDLDKAIICGHYIFSNPEVVEMRAKVAGDLIKKNIDLDGFLKNNIKNSIMRYIHIFNMI
ncbi:MAG: hypothetical protein GY730_03105 [bacterium]|nr:hypothetical protein [bacterium]